ncbi:hypothetical protein GC173_18710 [bacterium]|nr:hypothetical protein [bacterium]
MIKINLLPQEMAGRGGSASSGDSGGALVALVLALILLLNVGVGAYVLVKRNAALEVLNNEKALAAKVEKDLKETKIEYDEVSANLDGMRKLIELAERLDPPDRVLWSRKLNALPLLAPQGVFLTQIDLTQKITEVDTPESTAAYNEWARRRRGPQPVIEKVPVITQQLVMKGISYVEQGSSTQRLEQYEQFVTNLRAKKVKLPFDTAPSSFMEGLVDLVQLSPFSQSTIQGRDVGNFTVTLNTKPVTIK